MAQPRRARRKYVQRRWAVKATTPEAAALAVSLAQTLRISEVCARILVQRGHHTPDAADAFLSRRMELLHDPQSLPDIAPAVARIAEAIEKNQKVVLFGDYDVDGLSALTLLTRFLRLLKAQKGSRLELCPMVPERSDGYGLNTVALQEILRLKPQLLITLDNGVTAAAQINQLAAAGTQTIVVDHHQVGEELPCAVAVINPKRRDNAYPFTELCAAGLAFKLAWALAVHYSQNKRVTAEFRAFLLDAMGLAGAGTLADVVPLVNENRVLAFHGLRALARSPLPGLKVLLENAGISSLPNAGDVSFRIGPRLNAAGRCGRAADALELLLTDDLARATELGAKLESCNSLRQSLESQILESAQQQALELLQQNAHCRALVLHSTQWQLGVVGIVASRIVEEFHRPAVLLCVDEQKNVAQGSGRSVRKFHLCDALSACRKHLLAFGGHAAAAGLTLSPANISLFREQFTSHAATLLDDDDLRPTLHIDDLITLDQISHKAAADLELFEPCGAGNPRPTLAACGVSVPAPPRLMGKDERHLSFFARGNDCARRVIGFDCAEHLHTLSDLGPEGHIDLAFHPRLSTFRGETNVELMLEAFRTAES